MIRAKVIQNYYERFGNFDKIHNSFTGKLLEDGEDPYEALGYTPIYHKGKTISAKDVHDLRIAYLRNNVSTVVPILGFATIDDVKMILTKNQMLPKKLKKEGVNVSDNLKTYLDMLSEYYRYSTSYVLFKNNYLPLKDALAAMKFQPKAIKANVTKLMEDNKGVLVSVGSGDISGVYGRRLYTTKGLSEKQITTLQNKAMLQAALSGAIIPEKYVKNPLDLFMISFSDRDTYLNLLEMAELEGKTYAQLLEHIGFHVPNCENMYREMGVVLAIVRQRAVILMKDEQGEATVNYTTDLIAKQVCSKLLKG